MKVREEKDEEREREKKKNVRVTFKNMVKEEERWRERE